MAKRENINSGIVIGLLGVIASAMIFLNTQFITFIKENAEQHSKIDSKVTRIDSKVTMDSLWTRSVYTYLIQPNELRSKENKLLIEKHNNRITTIEQKL